MKYLLLACTMLLSGCVHSLLLVKAVQLHTSENNSFVKCIVTANDRVSQQTKAKADELCKEVQKEFGNTPSH